MTTPEPHSRRVKESVHSQSGPKESHGQSANTPPSPQVAHAEQAARGAMADARETIKHVQQELPHMAEQIQHKAAVVGEQMKAQAQSAARSVREEIAFIRKKFTGARLRDHVMQLGAALIVVSAMHLLINFLSPHMPASSRMFLMYLEHWQPGAFLTTMTVLSRAVDHLPYSQQYAWSLSAMCWTVALLGWTNFPFSGVTGILEKAAMSLPLNARNFVWLSFLPPLINGAVKRIRSF